MGLLCIETEISWKIKEKWFVMGARSHEERVCVYDLFWIFIQYFPDIWYFPLSLESSVILFIF